MSEDIEFEASNMEIKDDGNIIFAFNSNTKVPAEEIEIDSDEVKYSKNTEIVEFYNNVVFNDKKSDIIIKGNKVFYYKKKNLIYGDSNTFFEVKQKYKIKSKNVYYDRRSEKIYSQEKTIIEDKEGNIYELKDKFILDISNEIIKSKKAVILDRENNRYIFDDLIINLLNNEIAGKEIKVEFDRSYFGNSDNRPLMKGRSGTNNSKDLKVYRGVFSTCNSENKKCRGWELNTEEFNHDKEKKIFEYKNSWLKIFNYRLFFLPYFNHPDPSVKRKSGFLTPSYSTSTRFGTALNFPYFKVLGEDKDITFYPKYYADKSFLLQNEYRQVLLNSKITSDFSFLVGNEGTKSHFFYNQKGNYLDKLSYSLNLQRVDGDNYLKNHKLSETSLLVNDDSLLLSNIDTNWDFIDANLYTSFKIFEDLSRNYHDRYQYIFPEFNFIKNIDIPESYNGRFNFNSYGYNKNYDTNITESSITNDFLFSSNDIVNKFGFLTKYDMLLKNSNNYSDKSTELGEETNYNLFGTFKLDTNFPLRKKMKNYTHYINPNISFRYSPNGNSDLSSKDIKLDYNNAFILNRIGTSSEVESGEALSLGFEFKRNDKYEYNILDFKVANILKLKEDYKLPTKSKLNKTRSDIFGNLNYNFSKNLGLGYQFSYDRDLEYSNLDQIILNYKVNNFITNFNYYTENHDFGDEENLINQTKFNINNENRVVFKAAKDLKNDFTQYYDLVYAYETDCISINFNYNKSFYRDGNLEPNQSLSFLLKIIPFTELGVPNVGNLFGK